MSKIAEAVHAVLSETQQVTDIYAARGTHIGCGQCCGRFLPLFPHELVVLRHAAKGLKLRLEEGEIDMNCPLLDEFNTCMVYGKRPTICRIYDCHRHATEGIGFAIASGSMGMQPGMKVYDLREELS